CGRRILHVVHGEARGLEIGGEPDAHLAACADQRDPGHHGIPLLLVTMPSRLARLTATACLPLPWTRAEPGMRAVTPTGSSNSISTSSPSSRHDTAIGP